jgi:hypothetical protein
VKEGFFKPDYKNKSQIIKKEISEIDFKVKAVFCALLYQVNFSVHWSNLNDIYFLRNKASHGSLTIKELERLNKLIEKFPENNGYYQRMFNAFIIPILEV